MRTRIRRPRSGAVAAALAAVAGLLLSLTGMGQVAHAATGLHVSDGRLLEGNGNDFVMRGVNHAHTWYPERTGALADIKEKGANTVRVVLSSGDRWTRTSASEVSGIVAECRKNRLICVLEVHDTTGYGEDGAAATLDEAVDYWTGIRSVLEGQENHVVINLGNEPYGNTGHARWTADTSAAVGRMRSAGFGHALMVDAPNWGQDWSGTMRSNAASVFASDPDRNTVFSIHMYGVYDTAAEVRDYLGAFVSAGLPIVVGEFGDNHSDGNPDEDAIMATAQSLRLGYLGWSWSGNGSGVEYLDLVNGFDAGSLTGWGDRLFNGANGIVATAEEATVYGGGGGDGGGDGGTAPNGYPYCVRGSASDPDGDGWGWEDSRSCVVKGGRADGAAGGGTAPNGYPYCVRGSASDPDGDGWGWEDSRSCVVKGGRAD
ncbi:beta-mannosidase [Streptomyces nitrosporeus]|uniref:Beta-mannosidase n=1 Tax=Streptomyces nitrosporeus TaxID=28894 RepID=A0A5J6F383_9ACTN|nr:cellulase family glycosylhydrolase [Streptomyces nitrosporeus]QEU70798.1 beta-mannosidase [Streptomyces nitrosporeus]GGZ24615.1 beta-mannosidase [Streptomyces nitrosporeus]